MANFAKVARERQPRSLERRQIRGLITFIPVLGKTPYCLTYLLLLCHALAGGMLHAVAATAGGSFAYVSDFCCPVDCIVILV